MSARKEVIIQLTTAQREEIKQAMHEEVTHIKFWKVPGTVILAEAIDRSEPRASGHERNA